MEGALFDAGSRLDDSPPRAASRLRRQLARELARLGQVKDLGRRGQGLDEEARDRVRSLTGYDLDRGWPDFCVWPRAAEGRPYCAWVRALAATEKNAARRPRQWEQETEVFERLLACERVLGGPVVLAFDDGLALRVGDMGEGVHWQRTRLGRTGHVTIVDRGRVPLAEALS